MQVYLQRNDLAGCGEIWATCTRNELREDIDPGWWLCCQESPLKTLLSRIRRQKINLAADSSLTAAAWSAISKRFFVAIFYPRFSFCPLETNDSKKISAISFLQISEFKVLQYLLSFSAFGRPRQMCCLHGGGQGRQMHKVSVRFNFFWPHFGARNIFFRYVYAVQN